MPLQLITPQQRTSVSMVGQPRASVPALVDPIGAAVENLGKQATAIGQDMYQVQREADLQDRIGKATAEVGELELQLEKDNDFRTSPQRFKEGADAIQDKYLDGVSDQAVAAAFKKQFGTLSLAKSLSVRKAAWGKEKDYNVASLDSNIDTYAVASANSKNPAEAAVVEQQARLAIASAQTGGWISAEDAGKRERTYLNKRDSAVVIRDMSIDPMMTSTKLSVDPTYVPNIDPVQRERWADQAFRRAESERKGKDIAAEKARKARGDELLKDAFGKLDKGVLTRGYVDEIKQFIEPSEYKSLLASLSGADRRDDPTAFSELQGLVYSNPDEAERRAMVLHQQGRIRNETLGSIRSQARSISRQEGPKGGYEREKQFITNAIKPSDLAPDAAGSARYALVMREFDDYAMTGKRTDEELRTAADSILKKYVMVDMVDLARKTSAGVRATPEEQLTALQQQAEKLIADRDAKVISPQEFNRKMEPINRARKAAEKAKAGGGK